MQESHQLLNAINEDDIERVKIFAGHGIEGALAHASFHGNPKIVDILIQKGANINEDDDFALLMAVLGGNPTIVRMLINAGANANNPRILESALVHNLLEIVQILAENNPTCYK